MKKYLLVVSVLVLFVFLGTSCKKSKESKITGEWKYLPLNNVENTSNKQIWTFDGTNKLKIEVAGTDTTFVYDGEYVVSSKFMKGYYVNITGVYLYWNGLYKIEKLKSNVLILNRIERNSDSESPEKEGGVFLWKEFSK